MRDWRTLSINTTTREVIESFNVNANSSRFMDYVTGTIMNNGLLFTGQETVEGELVSPLQRVNLSGIVNSDTIFDNFRMYFREPNKIVELNQFPVDLTNYNDNKPHFLFIKDDLTYRVSDYIFGQSDENIICRFIINQDGTWNQMYIVAQRAGTPVYYAGEEFYTLDGINLASPGGLELSHTDGHVRRSGIEFNDKFSPDLYHSYATSAQRLPIRYTDLNNEVDYNLDPVYNVDPKHYMSYDYNAKKKTAASERIRNVLNAIYGIYDYNKELADELHHAITITTEQSEYRRIVNLFVEHMDGIYLLIGELGSFLQDEYFQAISRTRMDSNIVLYNNYMEANFGETVTIGPDTVQQMIDASYYLIPGNINICADPMRGILTDMYDDIQQLPVGTGVLNNVPEGKHTIQRVLWDIYENCLIVQYGDTVYDSLEDAISAVGTVVYPVPWGHLFYIPLAALVIRENCTDINLDTETAIVIKQYMYADTEQEGFADYMARALAKKALLYIYGIFDGTYPVAKSDTLKYTEGGETYYESGDYYLEYDNLRNRVTVVNNLNESTYNSKHALSAYQGYVLNQNKLARDGSQTFTGTQGAFRPETTSTSDSTGTDIGSSSNRWRTIYARNLNVTGTIQMSNGAQFVYSGGTNMNPTVVRLEATAKSTADGNWNNYENKTVVVAW